MSFKLTDEQRLICECVENGDNVIVDAVAGSGKTRTISEMVMRNPSTNFFILLYSANLKEDTRQRITSGNAFIHSFHSAIHYISPPCHNDKELLEFLGGNKECVRSFPKFDVLVVDECQDLTPLLLKVVVQICRSQDKLPQIVIIGDQYQCIYTYKQSDPRYLTLANQIFETVATPRTWNRCTLSTTFRCPKLMINFVNENLRVDRLVARKGARQGKICYRILNAFNEMPQFVTKWVLKKIQSGVNVADIVILVPSVLIKSDRNPLYLLVNSLSENDIDIYMRNSEGFTSKEQMRHKLCILTFHQSKGLEYKHVIVLQFDESYRTYYDKGLTPPKVVPNTIYVALTRAREGLLLIGNNDSRPFDFITENFLQTHRIYEYEYNTRSSPQMNPQNIAITDVGRHWSIDAINEVLTFVTQTQIEPEFILPNDRIYMQDTVTTSDNLVEFVADYNGKLIHQLWQSNIPVDEIDRKTMCEFFDKIIDDDVITSLVKHRKRQLRNTEWLSLDIVHRLVNHARKQFDYGCQDVVYEAPCHIDGTNIYGFIDGYNWNTNIVYELTTSQLITAEKIIQTALYVSSDVYDLVGSKTNPKTGLIFNACTGQVIQIDVPDTTQFVDKIYEISHREANRISDQTFLEACYEITNEF